MEVTTSPADAGLVRYGRQPCARLDVGREVFFLAAAAVVATGAAVAAGAAANRRLA